MSDNVVWRVIPEFPRYEINEHGDVRNRDSKKLLAEIENKNSGAFSYCLHVGWGNRTTHRNFWGLLYSAFPELLIEWRDVPGIDGYMFNQKGEVMTTRLWRTIPKTKAGNYILRANGKRITWSPDQLSEEELSVIWSDEKEQEAA